VKVRVNSIYRFTANYFMDRHATLTNGVKLQVGDLVQVINLHGCPPANSLGQCYVRLVGDSSKAFVMVATSSLEAQ
jgi:hypothetical protein